MEKFTNTDRRRERRCRLSIWIPTRSSRRSISGRSSGPAWPSICSRRSGSAPTVPRTPDFVLNQGPYRQAKIIVGGDNFGCGSSREHAPWALTDFGISCVIAPSFADIFYNNCFKNGLLPIALPQETIDQLMDDASKGANAVLTIDLESQTITRPDGEKVHFDIDPFRKHCLLNGLDDIGLTEQQDAEIAAYEQKARSGAPLGVWDGAGRYLIRIPQSRGPSARGLDPWGRPGPTPQPSGSVRVRHPQWSAPRRRRGLRHHGSRLPPVKGGRVGRTRPDRLLGEALWPKAPAPTANSWFFPATASARRSWAR